MKAQNKVDELSISLGIFGTIFALVFVASQTASASVVTDLPTDFANALDISTNLAGMILSMGILVALTLVLAISKMPPVGIVISLIAVMILLTVMTWLDQVVLIFTGIITAIYFGMTVKGLWG